MKRQKKYLTRDQIVADIDKANDKRLKIQSQATAHEDAAELFRVSENEVEFKRSKEESERLFAKASRIENTRLKRLGKTLAMFDTKPFDVEGLSQEQVTLQNA